MFEQTNETQQTLTVKMIVLGDVRVGKTTLTHNLSKDANLGKIVPTIAVEFSAMDLELGKDQHFRIKFWEISGQKKFKNLAIEYLQKVQAALVVFDLTNFESFYSAKQWIQDIKQMNEYMPIILFGNKKDLCLEAVKQSRAVKQSNINEFRSEMGIFYEEGCGISDKNLEKALKKMIETHFVPNQVIFEGQNEAKKCFCC